MLPLFLVTLLGSAVDNEASPSGLALSAALLGGVVGSDVVAGASIGIGVETAPFALHVRVPVLGRVVDNLPFVDAAQPSYCRVLRCEEWLGGEDLDPTALARLLDEVRVFQPGDTFHLRAGALTASLGSGAVLEHFTTAASWDRRTSGVFAALRLPWHSLHLDAVVGDVVSPGELIAVRVEAQPFDNVGLALAVDSGVDLAAPLDAVDRKGLLSVGAATRPVTSTALSARAQLLEGDFDASPRAEAQLTTGLSCDGSRDTCVGGGVAVGADFGVDFGVVDARVQVTTGLNSAGHRRGLFSTLYLVERRAALGGAEVKGGSLLRVAVPAGPGFDARAEASIFDVTALLLRLHLEPASTANSLEAGVVVDVDPVSVSLSLLRRGFTGADVYGSDLDAQPVVGAFQASWRFWGPWSASVRWLRLPRFGGSGGLSIDDDVLLSLSVNTTLVPR